MNRPELIDAFHDCLTWLEAGATLEACLQRYPDLAEEMRPLLQTAIQVRESRAGRAEVRAAQTRVRAQVLAELERQPRRWIMPLGFGPGLARLAVAAALVLVLAVVFAGRGMIPAFLQPRTPTPPLVVTLTPADTPTLTPSDAPSATFTATPTVTETSSATLTPTPSATRPATVTASPTVTASRTATVTRTPSPTPTGACGLPPGWTTYRVQAGDTLSRIAVVAQITLDELRGVNCLQADLLVVGQILFVPSAALPALNSAPVAAPASSTPPPPPASSGSGSGSSTAGDPGSTTNTNTNDNVSGGGDDNANDNDDDNDNDNLNDND